MTRPAAPTLAMGGAVVSLITSSSVRKASEPRRTAATFMRVKRSRDVAARALRNGGSLSQLWMVLGETPAARAALVRVLELISISMPTNWSGLSPSHG